MSSILIFLYTLLAGIGLLIALPFLLVFLPFRELKRRCSFESIPDSGFIWFHSASVGEVNALKPLLIEFKTRYPKEKTLVTAMTVTGLKTALNINECDFATLVPLDFLPFVSRFIRRASPRLLVIIETELWPSLLYAARLHKIPVCLVNGRISDNTFKNYRLLSMLIGKLYKNIEFVGAQSELDRQRFISLGFKNVQNSQNLKFSLQLPEYNQEKIRNEWNIKPDDFLIVWGSSRPGEEELLAGILPELQKKISRLKIIIAPRHLKRIPQILPIFDKFSVTLLSELTYESDIIIIDAMNLLSKAYNIADLAIIGGSFCDFGGHNPLEPAYYSIPTIIGNYHSSCRHMVKILLENSAIVVSSSKELLNDLLQLYVNPELRNTLGKNAHKTIEENSDSVDLNLEAISLILER